MPCFHPLKGWRSRNPTAKGKYAIVFNPADGYKDLPLEVACGSCDGCLLERSRQWSIRCMHEASLHEHNSFITLTFDDKHLPADGSLDVVYWQKFIRSFRKRLKVRVRYFHCGEYGGDKGRPHYHALLFGYDFPDKVLWTVRRGHRLYTSRILSELWTFGFSSIGSVSFESAAYVARYVLKKNCGEEKEFRYAQVDGKTAEILLDKQVKPEYVTMSRNPGLGTDWFKKFKSDVYPDGFVVVNGRKVRPPKFYSQLLELSDPELFQLDKLRLKELAFDRRDDNTPDRLEVREKCLKAKLKFFKREL